ncbi:MAG: hypothetical protein QOI26_751, partial [Pseudonocardiales bacterium]|nr:hypothetical protein [Pseudonocardiales bacterium]
LEQPVTFKLTDIVAGLGEPASG